MSVELRAAAQAFLDAWSRQDADAVAEHFEENADFVDGCGTWTRGRSEIRRRHLHAFKTVFRNGTISGRVESVRFVSRDLAVVHLYWKLRGAEHANTDRDGVLVLVFADRDGTWLIHAGHSTETPDGSERHAA